LSAVRTRSNSRERRGSLSAATNAPRRETAQTLDVYSHTPFTRYNRLSIRLSNGTDNRFDNRVERTGTVRSTGCQTELYNRFDNRLYTRYSRMSNRLSNRFDNRFNNRLYHVNGALLSIMHELWSSNLHVGMTPHSQSVIVKLYTLPDLNCISSVVLNIKRGPKI